MLVTDSGEEDLKVYPQYYTEWSVCEHKSSYVEESFAFGCQSLHNNDEINHKKRKDQLLDFSVVLLSSPWTFVVKAIKQMVIRQRCWMHVWG